LHNAHNLTQEDRLAFALLRLQILIRHPVCKFRSTLAVSDECKKRKKKLNVEEKR
jgi:hypothetical protein